MKTVEIDGAYKLQDMSDGRYNMERYKHYVPNNKKIVPYDVTDMSKGWWKTDG